MLGTILLASALGAILVGITIKLIRNKQRGVYSCSCGCGCTGCPSSQLCHPEKKKES